jgi:riboflavin kinase/FMN adenylyltransferase
MSFKEELAAFSPRQDTLLAIGVFDGVHLGHKALLSELKRQADDKGLIAGVVTFRKHPAAVLPGQQRLPHLTSLAEKIRLLREEGMAFIVTLSFTLELAQVSAEHFVSLLQKHLKMRGLVIGADFALGRNREGDAETLARLGRDSGFSVTVVPPVKLNDEIVSSTAIRNALSGGDMKKIRWMMGRYFRLEERVVTGNGCGADLGYPTANLDTDTEQALPADGVYATWAYIDNNPLPSVTSIGRRPTFGDGERIVEVYILGYEGNLYGSRLKIDIIERLRGEMRFDSATALTAQIEDDIKKAKGIFNALGRQ